MRYLAWKLETRRGTGFTSKLCPAVWKRNSAQGTTAVVYGLLCVCLIGSPVTGLLETDESKPDNTDEVMIQIRRGQSVVLPCNETLPTPPPDAATFLPYITQWKHSDIGSIYVSFGGAPPFIQPMYNGRVSLVDLKSLKIDNVRFEDEGLYECQIVILDGDLRTTENGTLIQLVVIGPPRFMQTPEPLVTYEEGDEARMECIAKGTPAPKLSWYKNGEAVVTGGHISVTSEAVLFNGVRREDAGTYICRAESEEGFVEYTARLLIKGAPHIFIPPIDTTATQNDDIIFNCEAEASPSNITQRWFFNDIPVETSRELDGRWEHIDDGGLMIRNVVPGDEGWYMCSPTNGLGKPPQATAFLTVQYPAYVVSMPLQIFVTRGLDTILMCDVDAKPLVDYIVWFKDGNQIAIGRLPRYNQEDDGSLVITSAELGDSGEYTCEPHNALGTAGHSTSTALIVRDPPIFLTKPEALYQQPKGKGITIPCSASGDPVPQIDWKKVNGDIPQYRSTITRTSLTIRDLTKSDHGVYECRATNEIATIVTSTKLYVEFTSPHPPYNVTIVTHITSVHVAWQPAYNGGYSQTYSIRYRTAESSKEDKGWTSMSNIAEDITSILLYNLESSTSYEFNVIATNQLGDSLASAPVYATTRELYDVVNPTDETGRTLFPPYLGLIPSPPRNVTMSITKQGLVLAWQTPVHFSDLVEKYAVEYRIDGPWLVLNDRIDAKKARLVLDGLQPNTTYQFRVFAFTPASFSDPSEVITEKIGDLSLFDTKPTGAAFQGGPGLIAGIIAGLCFLLLILMCSIMAMCLSHRRRKKKGDALCKANQSNLDGKSNYQGYEMTCVTPQVPQKPIYSPTPKKDPSPMPSSLTKVKYNLIPNNKPQNTSAPYHNHSSPNGKIPSNDMDQSLSEHLLSQLSGSYGPGSENKLMSEEMLRTEGLEASQKHGKSYDGRESPMRAQDTDSGIGHGDYTYSSATFSAGSSTFKDTDNIGNENISPNRSGAKSPVTMSSAQLGSNTKMFVSPKSSSKPGPHVMPKPKQQASTMPRQSTDSYSNNRQTNPKDYISNTESPYARLSPYDDHYYSSRTLPTRPSTSTSPTRGTNTSSDRVRLYSNPAQRDTYINPSDHTYESVRDTMNSDPMRNQGGALNEVRMRETYLLEESPYSCTPGSKQQSPYKKEQLSPVWQKQSASNTLGRKYKSPLYSTVERKT